MLDNDQTELDDLQNDDDVMAGEADPQDEGEGELVITLDGVAAEDDDDAGDEPGDVGPKGQAALKALRQANKESARKLKELERRLAAATAPKVEEEETLGPEPTEVDADFDPVKLVALTREWDAKKARIDAKKAEALAKQAAAQEAFKEKAMGYQVAKKALPVQNYEQVEAVVIGALDVAKQNIILRNLSGEEAARVVYALGKSPSKLDELAKMDADQFAFNLAKIAGSVKMERKPAQVETTLKGGGVGQVTGGWAARLKAAEAKADRTGIRTEFIALKAEAKKAGYVG